MRKPLDIEKVKEVLASEEIRKDASPAVMALTGIVFALLEEIVELRKENEELRRENEALRAENTMLKEKVRELEIRLNKDSSNSGKPPSSVLLLSGVCGSEAAGVPAGSPGAGV